MPGLLAATLHVPAATAETAVPLTVQVSGVRLLNVVRPSTTAALLVALTVPAAPPTINTGAVPNTKVWLLFM